ncbi:MAG: thioredoxin-dependent thiol peroxidase [Synechococcales cyanobacterium]
MSTNLHVGDPAPDFTLPDSDGTPVTLSQFRGQTVILYFYPRDNTPGCTQEACGFRDALPEFQARQAVILGISTDSPKSHQKFRDKFQLPFVLLADEQATVSTLYGVYGLKKFMGKEYMGIARTTFVIDPEGIIRHLITKVKVASHAQDVMALLA